MIYLIVGFFTGGFASLVMCSAIMTRRICDLEFQKDALVFELEQRKNDLLAYRHMYASAYEDFEDTK